MKGCRSAFVADLSGLCVFSLALTFIFALLSSVVLIGLVLCVCVEFRGVLFSLCLFVADVGVWFMCLGIAMDPQYL